ncbi:hypothetical protein L6452_26140 [Arctium lappa]|uniref:Uncharacterized protein n=1 Tax=Arctium lappa TaxID=4217 RepID=A0ACB9AD24_ARCLA|nr:hypothetical protein L6452_26140 [Arctium lappa]
MVNTASSSWLLLLWLMLLEEVNAASSKVLMMLKNNAAYVIKNSHGRMTAGWTEDYGKLRDNDGRYSKDILLINSILTLEPLGYQSFLNFPFGTSEEYP